MTVLLRNEKGDQSQTRIRHFPQRHPLPEEIGPIRPESRMQSSTRCGPAERH